MIKQFLSVVTVLTTLLLAPLTNAQIVFGKSATFQASICTNKSDAILIAETDANEGHKAAGKLFQSKDCASGVFPGTITKQVFSIKDSKDDNRIIRVLEVIIALGDGKVTTAYILTDMPVPGLNEI